MKVKVFKPRRSDIPFYARTMVPMWCVDVLAPGMDYFTEAGFPTWEEAYTYAYEYAKTGRS